MHAACSLLQGHAWNQKCKDELYDLESGRHGGIDCKQGLEQAVKKGGMSLRPGDLAPYMLLEGTKPVFFVLS